MNKVGLGILSLLIACNVFSQDNNEVFFKAAKTNDTLKLKELLKSGIDVNSKTKYGATALMFAVGNGHFETVRLLLENKADPNIRDEFYQSTPFEWSFDTENIKIFELLIKHGADLSSEWFLPFCVEQNQLEKVKLLLENKASGADKALNAAVSKENKVIVKLILDKSKIEKVNLNNALKIALETKNKEIIKLLKNTGAEIQINKQQKIEINYTGLFAFDSRTLRIAKNDKGLTASFDEGKAYDLRINSDSIFVLADHPDVKLIFNVVEKNTVSILFINGETKRNYKAIPDKPEEKQMLTYNDEVGDVKEELNWCSFRGINATGIADGQYPPVRWDAEKGINLKWKTFIPGLAHASPIVWDNNIYIVTAEGKDTTAEYRVGLYGDVKMVNDTSVHVWKLYCLNKTTGKINWERKAYEGIPKVKRHTKATQANSTPATNGKYIVALFGSEGMVCYDMDGEELWRKDLGLLDAGWFFEQETQWGHSSSPIIYKETVIVQVDRSKDSYIAAFDLSTGKEIWKTNRKEISSWGTPAVYYGDKHNEVITNGTKYIKAYNPDTGEELWKLGPNSEITVATPVIYKDLIYVTAGYAPVTPVYAIKPGGKGDLSIADSLSSGEFIKWRYLKGGTYMPSPIAYDGYFYTLQNNGVLCCYNAETGERLYRESLKSGAFTASIVAADGKLYCTSESKGVVVVAVGPEFGIIAKNPVGEICMATPAITDKLFIVRGQNHVFCFGRN